MTKRSDSFNEIHSKLLNEQKVADAEETSLPDTLKAREKVKILDGMEDEALGRVRSISETLEAGGYASIGVTSRAEAERYAIAEGVSPKLLKRDRDNVYWLPKSIH